MNLQNVAMVGFGAIGQQLASHLAVHRGARPTLLLVKPAHEAAARAALGPGVAVVTALPDLLRAAPDLVVEVGGHGALRQVGAAVLASGRNLLTVSAGALADASFRESLLAAAGAGGGRLLVAPGATAGLDGLRALREGGPFAVTYTSTKPPAAWKGTAAEDALDLDAVREPTCFFEGPADRAALLYPRNANVAATVALAGAGFADTAVRLVVDPAATGNHGRIEARSPFGTLDVSTGGPASANPRTSAITALSLAAVIRDRRAALAFG